MFLPYITLTAQIPAALQSHGSHYKPYILWLQADFIQKYPKCCVLPKFTIFHIHLIFPCCPSYIPPLSAARISWMGPFPNRPDAPSRTDPMYLPGPTGYPTPTTPRRPSSACSQLQPYGCNHFSKKGDCTCGPFRLLYGWIVNINAAEPQRG